MPTETIFQIITLSLIILVPFILPGQWGTRPSWWAVLGCLMYTASYLVSNAWQLAFFALPPLPAEIGDQLNAVMADAPASAYGFALRLYQAGALLLVAVYTAIIFFALRGDMQARLVWLVLAVAEGFAFLEYVQCKMIIDPFGSNDLHLTQVWGIEVSRFACGRVFGYASPYMAPLITSLYLIWVMSRRKSPQ